MLLSPYQWIYKEKLNNYLYLYLMNTIKRSKAMWIVHLLRHDNKLRHAIEGRMKGKRTRGRKRMML